MKPRFKPGQEVWTPYNKKAMPVRVKEILWTEAFIEYEIEDNVSYSDMAKRNCSLFSTKKECEEWIISNYA